LSDVADTIAFGHFQLDPRRRTLLADGKPVQLHPRAFDLLEFLVASRDRVVGRDEILAHVWRGMAIGDNNLAVQLSTLRRALQEHGADGLIITLPGRGYRFVGDVIGAQAPLPPSLAAPDNPPAAHSSRGWRIGLALVAVALACWYFAARHGGAPPAARLSVAVMPFRDLGRQPAGLPLADAITDDLTDALRRLPASAAIGRDMTASLSQHPITATAIGKQLGVRYLLEGSISLEDETVHVSTQLIDTGSGATLGGQHFDVARGKLSDARDTIVGRIEAALDTQLTSLEATRAEHERPDTPNATDLFLRARAITEHDDTRHGYETAHSLLLRAVALQPDFADAQAELGDMLIRKVRSTDDATPEADLADADAAIARALALSPHHPKALAAQAHARYVASRFTDAAYSAKAALEADPYNLEAQDVLAGCAFATGQLEEGTKALETLIRRNPEGAVAKQRLLRLGYLLLLQGRFAEAADRLNQAIAGDTDPKPGTESWGRAEGARMLLIAATGLAGHPAEAQTMYQAYERLWPHRTIWRLAATAARPMAALAGFARMLAALQAAGMPAYADEHADDHIPPSTQDLQDDKFAPTPIAVPGAATIDTKALAARLAQGQPTLILDLGGCAAIIQGALCRADNIVSDTDFIDTALRAHPANEPSRMIVIMADGTYGSESYNAALRLAASGRSGIAWYRGGEEAWASAGLPATDGRP